jgi:defect-in-organelle-trafficking protein DotB
MKIAFCDFMKVDKLVEYESDLLKSLYDTGGIPSSINETEASRVYADALLIEAVHHGASDVFIRVGAPVFMSIHEQLIAVTPAALDNTEVTALIAIFCNRQNAVTDIAAGRAVSTRYSVVLRTGENISEKRVYKGFRVQANPILGVSNSVEASAEIILRPISPVPPTIAEVGLTDADMLGMCPRDGCVYLAGVTGSGKSTTLAAAIRFILESDPPTTIKGNICTVEEPIEYTYNTIESRHSVVCQSQVPEHFPNFADAIKAFMRSAPRLMLVGEMRDSASVMAGIEAALTGHPVYTTVHATDVASIFRRLLTRFEVGQEPIFDIIDTTRMAIAQRLIPRKGGGRVALRQMLIFTPEVRAMLYQINDVNRITSAIRELVPQHGQTFHAHATKLFNEGLITEEMLNLTENFDR